MKRVITAVILIPLVLAAVLWLKTWIFSLAVGVVALIAADEFLRIAEATGMQPARYVTYAAVVALFIAYPLPTRGAIGNLGMDEFVVSGLYFAVPRVPLISLSIILAAAFFSLLVCMRRENLAVTLASASASTFGVIYVGLTLGGLVLIKDLPFGPFLVIYLFIVVWSGDIFAYYVGRAIGRHRMAPRISPKKSWEGAVASFISSIILGTLFFRSAPVVTAWMVSAHVIPEPAQAPLAWWRIVGLSGFLNVLAQLGDLFESMMKRGGGVKDSGALLPGHGGVLDRIDALLFAAPALWYYALFANI